ncbi:hypothetical protein H8E77_31305, partial [bacterium]|nr:hypothetical protein [bacterium]
MAEKIVFNEAQLHERVSAKTYQRAQEYVGRFTHRTIDGNEISGKKEESKRIFFEFVDKIRERNKDVDPTEVEALINEAV